MGRYFGGRRLMSPPEYTAGVQGHTHLVIPSPSASIPWPAVGPRQAEQGSCVSLGCHGS